MRRKGKRNALQKYSKTATFNHLAVLKPFKEFFYEPLTAIQLSNVCLCFVPDLRLPNVQHIIGQAFGE
jgi:hypothetical protein